MELEVAHGMFIDPSTLSFFILAVFALTDMPLFASSLLICADNASVRTQPPSVSRRYVMTILFRLSVFVDSINNIAVREYFQNGFISYLYYTTHINMFFVIAKQSLTYWLSDCLELATSALWLWCTVYRKNWMVLILDSYAILH